MIGTLVFEIARCQRMHVFHRPIKRTQQGEVRQQIKRAGFHPQQMCIPIDTQLLFLYQRPDVIQVEDHFRLQKLSLIEHGVAAVCAHTNLDMAQGGVNTCLAERLQLKNVRMLKEYEHSGLPEGLIGETGHPYTPEEFAAFVKDVLGCDGLKYVNGGKTITTVGLCGGAGADLTPDAAEQGAQAMVTADTKHNQLLDAEDMGITLVDAGHFFTEDVVIVPLMERLQNRFPEVKMAKSVRAHSPARFL